MKPNPSCSKNRKIKGKGKEKKNKMQRENKIKFTINDLDMYDLVKKTRSRIRQRSKRRYLGS